MFGGTGFQFLIGTLKTKPAITATVRNTLKFQFLIGTLKTVVILFAYKVFSYSFNSS